MSAQSIRMMKEFRILAWPWMAVFSAAILAKVLQSLRLEWGPINAQAMTALGFFVGIPLLAGLSIGSEFQYRTLGLSLAQPVHRADIWRSKILATLATVVPAGLLFCIGGNLVLEEFLQRSIWPSIAFLLVVTASAFPMTLIARSTIGGLALQGLGSTPFFWGIVWVAEYLRLHGRLSPMMVIAIAVTVLIYAAVMVWFGRRMFLGFQAVEGMQSVEAVLPGAALVPAFVADWFRCRPSGVVLNLIRREFRLLRTVWPLTLLTVTAWIGLVAFHIIPLSNNEHGYKAALFVFTVIASILIAILAGVLSLGEEKTSGTHDWQLTLPVSPSLQWFVKLSVAIFTSVFCGAILPMGILYAAGLFHGNLTAYFPIGLIWVWPLEMAGITFAAFWCACLMKGTVRAAVLTFPALLVVFSAGPLGDWLSGLAAAPLNHFSRWLVTSLGPVETSTAVARIFETLGYSEVKIFAVPAILLLSIALIQSHRSFREHAEDSKLRVVRYLSPMFLTVLVLSLAMAFLFDFAKTSFDAQEKLSREVDQAIEKAILRDNGNRKTISIDSRELAKGSALSPEAQRWLAGSMIAIIPRPSLTMATIPFRPQYFGFINWKSDDQWPPYSAVVRFDRTSCSIGRRNPAARPVVPGQSSRVVIFAAICN